MGYLERLLTGLKGEAKALSLTGPRALHAFDAALAPVLALLLALALDVPDPWWAAFSAWRITQADLRSSLSRGLYRILGSVLGGFIGYVLVGLFTDQPLAMYVALFVVIACTLFISVVSRYSYAWLLGGITVVLVVFASMSEPGLALGVAYFRVFEVILGVAAGWFTAVLLLPADAGVAAPKPASPTDPRVLRMAVVGATGVVLLLPLWATFDLPGLTTLGVSILAVSQLDEAATMWKSVNRIAGCVIGAGLGLVALALCDGQMFPWLLSLFALLFVFAQVQDGGSPVAYTGAQAGMGCIIAMVQGAAPATDITAPVERVFGIAIAICVLTLVAEIMDPLWDAARARFFPPAAPPSSPPEQRPT